MKKQFRILATALALCLSLLCCPAAFAAVDSSSCQTVPYAQATSQPLGQPITIKRARAVHLPARRPARWCGSPPMAARSTTATPTAAE